MTECNERGRDKHSPYLQFLPRILVRILPECHDQAVDESTVLCRILEMQGPAAGNAVANVVPGERFDMPRDILVHLGLDLVREHDMRAIRGN